MPPAEGPVTLGRYELAEAIGAGGMATIYLARQAGAVGFSRVVAVKRLHAHRAQEPEFIAMFLDEARLAARVRHPNVVETLDVVHDGAETFIVLEYVDGESLAALLRATREAGQRIPLDVAAGIVTGICRGLHAAHEARGPNGEPLGIVHRDVSPQNVIVGADGVTRVTDFGVALANVRLYQTRPGDVKGKPAYMAPEQLSRDEVTRASDVYAAGVILWELCAGRRAYDTNNEGALMARVMAGAIPRLADVAPWVPPGILAVVDRALRREPAERFRSANEMADALESVTKPASATSIGSFVERFAPDALRARRRVTARLESGGSSMGPAALPSVPPSGAGLAAPPGEFVGLGPPSQRPLQREDTQGRITHTLTAAGAERPRRRALALVVAFVIAVLAAASLGVAGAWFFLRAPPRADANASPTVATSLTAGEPSASVPGSAPTESTVTAEADETAVAEPGLESTGTETVESSSARVVDRIRVPPRSAGSAAPSSNPCDPPYYIDAAGIRRVKRNCF